MIVRLIAETLTPIVAKSRFIKWHRAQGVISNRPYHDLEAPARHRCRTSLIVKQGADGFPFHARAHIGFLHLDFKAHTIKQARRKVKSFLRLHYIGKFTTWGYGRIGWLFQKNYYSTSESISIFRPRFRILKGLPPNLSHRERQLVMAALLHDLVDTDLHPSKLGISIMISDSYIQWLCDQHHSLKKHATNPDLQLLQEADGRTSNFARLVRLPTARRKMAPVNTQQLAHQLQQAAQRSVYKLYSTIYYTQELTHFIASKVHPTESLSFHLLGVANWVLFLLRTRTSASSLASAPLVGQPGATPGPVEMEDPRTINEP